MPLLFFLGQHATLEAVQRHLREDEKMFACLDDIYIVTTPARVGGGVLLAPRCPVPPRPHPSARWEDPSVEQRWHVHRYGPHGETQGSCVERISVACP